MELVGELAFKNIKREKKNYKTIVISITVSIIIFLTTTGFARNLFLETEDLLKTYEDSKFEYKISYVNQDEIEGIIEYLNKDNLINDYVIYRTGLQVMKNMPTILIPNDKISEQMKKAIKNGVELSIQQYTLEDQSLVLSSDTYNFLGDRYNEILKRAGIESLAEDEVIISNTVNKKYSRYGDKINYTKYEVRRYNTICWKKWK